MVWKRKPKDTDFHPPGNRISALADRLEQEGRIGDLEQELHKFDPTHLDGAERESWHHLHGSVPFRQGNRPLAFERFLEGVRDCPDSGCLQFGLGQEYEFRGEPERMFDCFDKALFPGVPASYALAQARYAYLWDRTDKGWSYLEPLLDLYFDLKILDSTFLFMRGIPFFQQTWDYLAAFSQLKGNFERLRQITARVESDCQDIDVTYLRAELAGAEVGDFAAVKERLCSSIQNSREHGFDHGYQDLRLHVLLAQEARDEQEAVRLLDSVELTPDDFPWLADIRVLAKCEQARKAGAASREADLIEEFLSRQPLLFEPDHAVNFNLLRYQENLKEIYQSRRRANGSSS